MSEVQAKPATWHIVVDNKLCAPFAYEETRTHRSALYLWQRLGNDTKAVWPKLFTLFTPPSSLFLAKSKKMKTFCSLGAI